MIQSSRSGGFGFDQGGDVFGLDAEGEEDVLEAVEGEVAEEVVGEVEGEGGAVVSELADEGAAVH